MKRLRLKLLTRFWFLSLLLCIAFLVLWVISQRITTPAVPSTFAIQAALNKRIPQIRFANIQFRDALEFLSDQTGVQFEIDAEMIDPIDYYGTSQNITLQITNVRAGEAINKLQAALSPKLCYWTSGSRIRISVRGSSWHANRAEQHPPDDVFQALQKQAGQSSSASHPQPIWEGIMGSHRYTLVIARTGFRLWITPPDPAEVYQDGTPIGNATDPEAEQVFNFAGLSLRRSGSPLNTQVIAVPFWLFVAIAAIPPLLALRRRLHERRCRLRMRCAACGYDLRASPDRCPECGYSSAQSDQRAPINTSIVN